MKKKVKRLFGGGLGAGLPTPTALPVRPTAASAVPPTPSRPMPDRSNFGGQMRGLDRARAMSGRDFDRKPAPAPTVPAPTASSTPFNAVGSTSTSSWSPTVSTTSFPIGTMQDGTQLPQSSINEITSAQNQMSAMTPEQRSAFMKKGGKVKAKKMASGGTVSSASKRADGCAQRGKTRGRMV